MTTEHFTLQTAKSATIAEANGRSSLFMSSVSSAVVALAFVGQVSQMGEAFFIFGLVLFPSLFFLGIVTFGRVLETGNENMLYTRGINRIRHYYAESAPETARYFILSTRDDAAGALQSMAIPASVWETFLANAGMVLVINSVLAGVFAGIFSRLAFSIHNYAAAGLGILVFAVSAFLHRRWQNQSYQVFEKKLKILFPSEPNSNESP